MTHQIIRRAIVAFVILFTGTTLAGGGKIVAIADGDTLTILTPDKQQVKVRLAEIDTPARGQPYANKAKQALAEIVFGKTVAVLPLDTDRYGRTVGRVYIDGLDVNEEMVRRGHAWVYREYVRDQSLFTLEDQAREARVGIWALPEADLARQAAQVSASKETFECGTKRYCKEMASCAEARHFLTVCGVQSLDRDKDGIPCESICGG